MTNKRTLTWIGGWAGNIACWENDIRCLYPEAGHVYIDAMDIIREKMSLDDIYHMAGSRDWIAAWSMGSLVLHQWLAEKRGSLKEKNVSFLSICPVFDFCGEPKGWHPLVVRKMIRKLDNDKEQVLVDFLNRMDALSQLTHDQRESWFRSAKAINSEVLIQGLSYLMAIRVPFEKLKPFIPQLLFAADINDPLAPLPGQWESISDGAVYTVTGHVPFLSQPDVFRSIFRR
jgi:hypothetical protein